MKEERRSRRTPDHKKKILDGCRYSLCGGGGEARSNSGGLQSQTATRLRKKVRAHW